MSETMNSPWWIVFGFFIGAFCIYAGLTGVHDGWSDFNLIIGGANIMNSIWLLGERI